MTMIELKNIKKTYTLGGEEIKAVDDVTFNIKKGEYFLFSILFYNSDSVFGL